jgi:predicted DNA-binding transcriptional regulator YafY
MQIIKDTTKNFRVLQVLRAIMERPNGYTKKDLMERCEVSESTIKRYFTEIKNAGFDLKCDENNYRYEVSNDKPYEYLKDLLFFSEKDQDFMLEVLGKAVQEGKQKERIVKKLESIYDFTRLGSHLISGQFLTKINLLEQAKLQQKVVELVDYRSTNSSQVSSRKVEPFHIMPKEDILHAFDIEKRELRHYRISRIARVELNDLAWTHQGHHQLVATDCFRIANAKQVRVRLRLKVGGYNELLERFPLTIYHLEKAADEKDVFELDCMVNKNFYGLTNFILGYHHHIIEIIEPDSLLDHIKTEAQKLMSNFF